MYWDVCIDVVVRGTSRRCEREVHLDKPILLDVTHADSQAQVHLRRGSADHEGSAASTSMAGKRQHYARLRRVSFDERSRELDALAVESFGCLGVESSKFIDQVAVSVEGGADGGSMPKKGVVKEFLLQIVSVTAQLINSRRVSCFKLQFTGSPGSKKETEGGRGGVLIFSCFIHLTIDHASLSRRSTVPTPDGDTSNIWALITLLPYITDGRGGATDPHPLRVDRAWMRLKMSRVEDR